MIERIQQNQNQPRARRNRVVPSRSLRPHFLSLARQVVRWTGHRTGPTSIGITSLDSRVGRSTVSFNLAAAMTSVRRGKSLLVESDFGKHYIARRLGKSRDLGLAEMLIGTNDVDLIAETPIENLYLLGCGQKSGSESLELPFDLLRPIVKEKLADFEYLIFDLPQATTVTACHSLAAQMDGIILTIESHGINQRKIQRFKRQMENAGVEVIGVVINKS